MKKACILIFAALLAGSALDVAQDMSSILQGTPPSCAPAPQNLKPRADPASLEPGIPPPGKSLVYVIDSDPNRLARILGVCVNSFAVDVLHGGRRSRWFSTPASTTSEYIFSTGIVTRVSGS